MFALFHKIYVVFNDFSIDTAHIYSAAQLDRFGVVSVEGTHFYVQAKTSDGWLRNFKFAKNGDPIRTNDHYIGCRTLGEAETEVKKLLRLEIDSLRSRLDTISRMYNRFEGGGLNAADPVVVDAPAEPDIGPAR